MPGEKAGTRARGATVIPRMPASDALPAMVTVDGMEASASDGVASDGVASDTIASDTVASDVAASVAVASEPASDAGIEGDPASPTGGPDASPDEVSEEDWQPPARMERATEQRRGEGRMITVL